MGSGNPDLTQSHTPRDRIVAQFCPRHSKNRAYLCSRRCPERLRTRSPCRVCLLPETCDGSQQLLSTSSPLPKGFEQKPPVRYRLRCVSANANDPMQIRVGSNAREESGRDRTLTAGPKAANFSLNTADPVHHHDDGRSMMREAALGHSQGPRCYISTHPLPEFGASLPCRSPSSS